MKKANRWIALLLAINMAITPVFAEESLVKESNTSDATTETPDVEKLKNELNNETFPDVAKTTTHAGITYDVFNDHLEGLSESNLYQLSIISKYELMYRMTNNEDTLDDLYGYGKLYGDILQKISGYQDEENKDANQAFSILTSNLDTKTLEKVKDYPTYLAYLQSLTDIKLDEVLEAIEKIDATTEDSLVDSLKWFREYLYSVYEQDEPEPTKKSKQKLVVESIVDYDMSSDEIVDSFIISQDEREHIKEFFPSSVKGFIEGNNEEVEIPVTWSLYLSETELDYGINLYQMQLGEGYVWSETMEEAIHNYEAFLPVISTDTRYTEYEEFNAPTLMSYNPVDNQAYMQYDAHCQTYGWMNGAMQGGIAGTENESKRMEAFKIYAKNDANLGVKYRAYIEGTGWTSWSSDGAQCGTTGEGKTISQIEVQLTGTNASEYTLSVKALVQNTGWVGAGAVGSVVQIGTQGRRMEAIMLDVTPVFTLKTGYHLVEHTNVSSCTDPITYTCGAPIKKWTGEGVTVTVPETKMVYADKCAVCNRVNDLYLYVDDYHHGCSHISGWARDGARVTGYCTVGGDDAPVTLVGNRNVNAVITHTFNYCPKHNVANTYTVKYDGNGNTGGSTANSSHTYDVAKNLTVNGFSKSNYTFTGWNTKADGSGTSYTDKQSVKNLTTTNNGTVTLYAQWKSNNLSDGTYTVKYNGNGNTGGSTASSKHTIGVAKNLTKNGFTRTGYTFKGWSKSSSSSTVSYTDQQSVTNLSTTNGATVNLYAV